LDLRAFTLLAACGAALPVLVDAQIYRCTQDDSVIYQDSACPHGYSTAMVVPGESERISVVPSTIETSRVINADNAPTASDINVGMTDSQVLNARGWGRPQKITRSKAKRAWHEDWLYQAQSSTSGDRRLHFINGRLASIQTGEPEAESVVAATQDSQR
jgi:hypothetical protein